MLRAPCGSTRALLCEKSRLLESGEVVALFLARFRLCVALSEGGFSNVGHLDPLPVRRGHGVVVVVPIPPLVRRGLGITLRRVLPSLLTAERADVEIAPGGPHRLVAAEVDEVRAEHPLAVAEEYVVA